MLQPLSIRLVCSIFLAMTKKAESKPENPEARRDSRPDSRPLDPAIDKAARGARIETGGPKGPEPTRYGDWEKNGRCSDF